jgi:UDP-glucose 4-epimerase
MRILLTGPNSFSGKVVLEYFVSKGYDITTISRQTLYKDFSSKVTCIYNDLAKIKELTGPFDTVVHIAATSPMQGVTAANLIQDNALATQNLIELVQDADVKKFIFFSTCSVYGEVSQSVLRESTPIDKPCSYGASKLMCEAMLREQTSFQTVAIRLPAVIGRGAARHWLANTINKAKAGQDITIYNPDAVFNNAIPIRTLAQFIDRLLHVRWLHGFDVVNVASQDGLPISKIIEKILVSSNSSSKVSIASSQKSFFSISCQYAMEHYGFEPLAFSNALKEYLDEC